MESGLNSRLRGEFSRFWFEFSGFSGILIAINIHLDRDHDEQFPIFGRRLIAIKGVSYRDLLGVFGDRDQGLGRITILQKYFAL